MRDISGYTHCGMCMCVKNLCELSERQSQQSNETLTLLAHEYRCHRGGCLRNTYK